MCEDSGEGSRDSITSTSYHNHLEPLEYVPDLCNAPEFVCLGRTQFSLHIPDNGTSWFYLL